MDQNQIFNQMMQNQLNQQAHQRHVETHQRHMRQHNAGAHRPHVNPVHRPTHYHGSYSQQGGGGGFLAGLFTVGLIIVIAYVVFAVIL
ncbi:hypothetical protein [Sphaerisporangium fuscum]|uniref:hypothetical protein n=1 Tax=Sphaerisporangium fuscum TaxID=2835868 RepID=UPI001BDCEFCF|nr:hypothetical protein [Sphaerisporangium fuscum]